MEVLEQKEAEAATAGEDEEAEIRQREERSLQEEEVREGLVQQLASDKTCGGLLLRDLPEGTGNKSKEKQESLLMLIYASNLGPQEQDRMMNAEVKVTRRERARKGTIDLTLTLAAADGLLRKVWHQLERPCAQEGVKRYMIEASSEMTPVRLKPPTMFMKARAKVKEIIEEESLKALNVREHEKTREEELQAATKTPEQVQTLPDITVAANANKSSKESGGKEVPMEKEASSGGDDISQHTDADLSRVKRPIWVPPEGYGRCGRSCEGCVAKCLEQNLENCQNCHINSLKGGKSNPCHNRKECFEPKPKTQTTARGRSTGQKIQRRDLILDPIVMSIGKIGAHFPPMW